MSKGPLPIRPLPESPNARSRGSSRKPMRSPPRSTHNAEPRAPPSDEPRGPDEPTSSEPDPPSITRGSSRQGHPLPSPRPPIADESAGWPTRPPPSRETPVSPAQDETNFGFVRGHPTTAPVLRPIRQSRSRGRGRRTDLSGSPGTDILIHFATKCPESRDGVTGPLAPRCSPAFPSLPRPPAGSPPKTTLRPGISHPSRKPTDAMAGLRHSAPPGAWSSSSADRPAQKRSGALPTGDGGPTPTSRKSVHPGRGPSRWNRSSCRRNRPPNGPTFLSPFRRQGPRPGENSAVFPCR